MLSDLDIYRAAHLMMHSHGGDAELEAAINADRVLRRGNRDELLTWFRIWRTIAEEALRAYAANFRMHAEMTSVNPPPVHTQAGS